MLPVFVPSPCPLPRHSLESRVVPVCYSLLLLLLLFRKEDGRWYDKIPFRRGLSLHVFIWVTPGVDTHTYTLHRAALSLSELVIKLLLPA